MLNLNPFIINVTVTGLRFRWAFLLVFKMQRSNYRSGHRMHHNTQKKKNQNSFRKYESPNQNRSTLLPE